MRQIFFLIFLMISALHLYGTWKDNQKLRVCTKGLLVPSLLGYYLCSSFPPAGLTLMMLSACWIGDMLLMKRGVKWFVAGGIAFGVAHGCLIAIFLPHIVFSSVSWRLVIVFGAALGLFIFKMRTILKRYLPASVLNMMMLYLLLNAVMNLFACMQLMSGFDTAAVLQFAGALLFFVSDTLLFLVRFDKKSRVYKKHFGVMLTYILAKFFLVQGIIILMIS